MKEQIIGILKKIEKGYIVYYMYIGNLCPKGMNPTKGLDIL